jgi:hypothetical protein
MLHLATIASIAAGVLSVLLCPVPVLGFGLGVAAAIAGLVPFARARSYELRLAAAGGLIMGLAGILGSINVSIASVAAYRARQAHAIEADLVEPPGKQ